MLSVAAGAGYSEAMMSGPHPLHAGDGYEYLTRQVAAQDRDRDRSRDLTDYYTEHGTPPGTWWGAGSEAMGLTGDVTESQMQALFGEGLHPDADRIIQEAIEAGKSAREAIEAAQIGPMLSEFGSKPTAIAQLYAARVDEFMSKKMRRPTHDERMILRTDAAHEQLRGKLGRKPTKSEINAALGAEKKQTRRAVTGFDCVFTPTKSVSVLWGLADDVLRKRIYECHRQAVDDTLKWAEEHFALARRGRGGIRQIDTAGLTVARFDHYDNRTGDPNPHTHAVISTKVLGSDGKWSSLDARALFAGGTALSSQYNAMIVGYLKREIGFEFEAVSHGPNKQPVLEIADVPTELRDLFSRRADIVRRTEELVAEYRATHGRDPSKKVQIQLSQQATLDTRDAKPIPKSLREMVTEWDEKARPIIGEDVTGAEFAAQILRWHTDPAALRPFDAERVAITVGADLGGRLGIIGAGVDRFEQTLHTCLDRCQFDDDQARSAAAHEVRELLHPERDSGILAAVDKELAARQDRIYDPERIAKEVTETVARRRATWTESHIRSATLDRLGRCDFPSTAAQNAAIAEIVRAVRDGHSLQLTIDPDVVPPSLQRSSGESEFTTESITTIRYTSEEVLAAENHLREAAQTPTAEFVHRAAVDRAIAEIEAEKTRDPSEPYRLNEGQRRIVQHLCTSGMRLDVAIGPAGAGKTTAMTAAVRAWRNDGRDVVALAPSAAAARVLSDDIGVQARTIDSLLTKVRMGGDSGITRGTMILVDEAAMASTANLLGLQKIADEQGAVVKYIGDPYQLSAVESGGMMRLIARETRAPELNAVVRFATEGEATASLHVRNGDPVAAFEWYSDNHRINVGMTDDLRTQILTHYLADQAEGTKSLMMAATLHDVAALNGAAQSALALAGDIETKGPKIGLADGHTGWIGDRVVTRKNNNRLRITGGKRRGTPIDNGDLWTIRKIHDDGSVTVSGLSHRGTINLPADYVKAHLELGYATTVHRSQGMTVQKAYLLMNATLGRALAYVGLTRGAEHNEVFMATDSVPDPGDERQPGDPDEPPTAEQLWQRVMAREDDNITATEVMREEQARISDPVRLRAIYDEITENLAEQRGRHLLESALPVVIWHEVEASEHLETLLRTLAIADQHRLHTGVLINDIATNFGRDFDGETLLTARDVTALLRSRADRWIADHLTDVPSTTTAHVETLAVDTFSDAEALTAAAAGLNIEAEASTTRRGGRFYAVRDAEPEGLPLVPSRFPGMDTAVADYAEELRVRLLGGAATTPVQSGPVPASEQQLEEALHAYETAHPDPHGRRRKMRADFNAYVQELTEARSRHLIDRALPEVLGRSVRHSRAFGTLLQTLALAEAHHLDTGALVLDISSNGGRDHGESLMSARDPAALLRWRADQWIATHLVNTTVDAPAVATLSVTTGDDEALTDYVTQLCLGTDTLAVEPMPDRFRALDDLDMPRGLAPIPPEFPGMDTAVADYADELRRRILDLPDDSPDWRERAAARPSPTTREEIIDDIVDDWIGERSTTLAYPELDHIERVTRLRAEFQAAQDQVWYLTHALVENATPHELALEPLLDELRSRVSELAPLTHELRQAEQDYTDAQAAVVEAEDAYHQALKLQPEAADEQWFNFLQSKVDDSNADPATRAQLNSLLGQYRTVTDEANQGHVAAEVHAAKSHLDYATDVAEDQRLAVLAAREALDNAAGDRLPADWRDIEYVRMLGSDLALADLSTARENLVRLQGRLARARSAALDDRTASTGVDRTTAAAELEQLTTPTQHAIDDAMATVVGRSGTDNRPSAFDPTANTSVDNALAAARHRIRDVVSAVDTAMPLRPIVNDELTAYVRAHADAITPWAVAADLAERAWREAETEASYASAAAERAAQKEPDPFASPELDPVAVHVRDQLAGLDVNSPEHAQLTAMLEQYTALAAENAAADLAAEQQRAADDAVAARAHADQLRAAADQAKQELRMRTDAADHAAEAPSHADSAAPVTTIEAPPALVDITAATPMDQAVATYLDTIHRADLASGTEPDRRAPAWVPAPPALEDTSEHAELARRHYAAIAERTAALADLAAVEQPGWTTDLGPVPRRPIARAEWMETAGHVAAWREQHGIADTDQLLGDRPADENQAHTWDQLTEQAEHLRAREAAAAERRAAEQRREQELEAERRRRSINPDGPGHDRGIDI